MFARHLPRAAREQDCATGTNQLPRAMRIDGGDDEGTPYPFPFFYWALSLD